MKKIQIGVFAAVFSVPMENLFHVLKVHLYENTEEKNKTK